MEKKYTFQGSTQYFDSQDKAIEAGKRYLAKPKYGCQMDQMYILETVAVIKTPVPEYEVVKL